MSPFAAASRSSSSSSADSAFATPSSSLITSTNHRAPSSQPAFSASPSGERPILFLMSISSIPGPDGCCTKACATARCALSAAQCSAVDPALLDADRRVEGTRGRRRFRASVKQRLPHISRSLCETPDRQMTGREVGGGGEGGDDAYLCVRYRRPCAGRCFRRRHAR